jgi:hypothetical protein
MLKRGISVFGAVVIAAAVGALAGGSAAHAQPYDCWTRINGSQGAAAFCNKGTGEFRVEAICDIPLFPDKVVVGNWSRSTGTVSVVRCPSATRRVYNVAVGYR